jgi:hypothetical protein
VQEHERIRIWFSRLWWLCSCGPCPAALRGPALGSVRIRTLTGTEGALKRAGSSPSTCARSFCEGRRSVGNPAEVRAYSLSGPGRPGTGLPAEQIRRRRRRAGAASARWPPSVPGRGRAGVSSACSGATMRRHMARPDAAYSQRQLGIECKDTQSSTKRRDSF